MVVIWANWHLLHINHEQLRRTLSAPSNWPVSNFLTNSILFGRFFYRLVSCDTAVQWKKVDTSNF